MKMGAVRSAMQENARKHVGALIGWKSLDMGERVAFTVQTHDRTTWEKGSQPISTTFLMTKSQATVLANDLLKLSGTVRPPRPRRWRRWLAFLYR